jgi:hypothetical protein
MTGARKEAAADAPAPAGEKIKLTTSKSSVKKK